MAMPIERMLVRQQIDRDGCWIWPGAKNTDANGNGGYGTVRDGMRTRRVHIVSYEHFVGPVPPGLVLDHLCHDDTCQEPTPCKHRLCWNPAHLDLATPRSNTLRGGSPNIRTHRSGICARGHVLAETGAYTTRLDGVVRSRCRVCVLDRQRRYRAARAV